jgi:amino acid adenylation domain-containing protein
MRPNNIEDIYPLSPMQQGILFHARVAAAPETYVVQIAWTLQGVDVAALRRAFQDVMDRHPALRTAFAWEKLAEPVQIVWKRLTLACEEHDLRALPPAEQAERVRRFTADDRERGFDLTRAPLLRIALLRLAEGAYRFVWSMHHLLLDGWSTQLVVRELFALHDAYAGGREVRLDRARPYADYIGWLQKQDQGRSDGFWRRELAGLTAPTPLGVDHPAPPGEPRFGERRLALPDAAGARLEAFAREHALTLSTLVQGAWALLLSRYGRRDDVLFGATVSGRSAPVPGIEGMVGLFINTLPVRVRVRADEPVLAWLARLQQHEAELREHEHGSLARIQALSEVPQGTPLFESLVVFENFPVAEAGERRAGGKLAVRDAQGHEQPPYPLTLSAFFSRSLRLQAGYDARRFDEASVDRLLGHVAALLEAIVAAPGARLGQLSLLTGGELADLTAWNATQAEHPRDVLLHELFEAQAARTPEAVAVSFAGRPLTYRALDEQSSRIANHLVSLGVGPDVLVGVAMERSLDLCAALLGVLKAGGAYVPIDPSYPAERVAFMLADAGAPVVLTQAGVRDRLPRGAARVVAVDAVDAVDEEPALAGASVDRSARRAGPENLAYVIYTSGSTGRPKGAMIPHRAIVNHMLWMHRAHPLGAGKALLQKTPISFDASVWELWLPLMGGARLVMAEPGGHRDARYLVRAVIEERITDLQLVPSVAELLLLEPDLPRCTSLERVFLGGEALSRSLVTRLLARREVAVINLYGPTECAVQAVTWEVDPARDTGQQVPIGRPIDNVEAHVLGPSLERLPAGVPGELCLGGRAVGRGYWGRPDLTAEVFVPDPFRAEAEARLYRTGDLCRRLPSGVLEYLGRLDHQVKVRGVRVELGEIEGVLRSRPTVREAVAMVREDAPGDARLVAYVTLLPAGDERSAPAELRAAARAQLPEPMVPSAIVVLDALPRLPSGKVDRRALPVPGAAIAIERVAPSGPIEEALAAIFAEVLALPVEQVGASDGFFELGGHSLSATQAVTRIRAALGVDLPLRAVFDAPTPAALAARVEALLTASVRPGAPDLVPVARGGALPLSFGQERLWFLAQLDPTSPAYVIPLALRLAGDLDDGALERALTEIVRRHEVLRTTFRVDGGKPAQVIHAPGPVPLERASLADLPADARERALRAEAEAEARRPFDLGTGPVLRVKLLEVAAGDHVLLLTLHHIVSDAWTSTVLLRELAALYAAFRKGDPSPLPELPLQYADYAVWQRGWLSGGVLEEQIDYWKEQLAGAPPALELPTDRPRPPVQSFRGAQQSFALSPELTAAIKDLARREGATLYMVLLAAFDVLLHRHTGQDDVVVGTPIAGRTRREVEGLVGFFLNTLVMRTRLAPDLTFKQLVARVKEVSLGAYAHQDMPFERLVQEIQPAPDPGRSPLFQVIFNLQNAPREGVRLPGLALRGAVAENATVKVDLTLLMADLPRGLAGRVEYASDLFDGATIARFVRQLETLLAAVTREPQRLLRDLPVLPDDERQRLLVAWNDTDAPFSTRERFHELFEAQVDATPGAPALVAGPARLTYAELDRRANQLAHHLRRRGVGPDVVVGLCCPRTADLVVALLGILKAGGAYVPLDPAYPPRRLAQILGEARAAVVVTVAALAANLPGEGVTAVRLDADAGAIAAESEARPGLEAASSDLAYVLFTSGSTGAPKGVAVEHRQLVNYVRGVAARLDLARGATYAHVSTFSADLGNTVLFPSLATGGCLHLLGEALTTDPDAFAAYLQREGIDCLKIVPSHLAALLSAAHPDQVLPRKLLVLGGEALRWDLVARIEHLAPGCRIVNHYGPTETTVGVLTCPIESVAHRDGPTVPLGRPLPNSRVYVLDAQMQPAPTGVPGELYVGGAGVARGYHGRPDLTVERFLKDPFSPVPGARLYRTGDRARYLPDGTLLFLGRADSQVKIRGHRIELGEIEAALADCPSLRGAVVLVDEAALGDARLVAYVVPSAPAPDVAGVRAFLAERLPEPMIPSAFVVLGALPLTPNGKIDRRALAALARPSDEASDDAGDAGPRTPVEEVLAALWADVFARERVGVHERFADLGGHSLLAIQIIARARDAFQVSVPLRAIFEAPTVAALAARIEALRAEGERLEVPPVTPVPRDRPLPLSFAQERLWFLDRLEPGSARYNVASALRLEGALDAGALERALREVVRRHEVLRTTFALQDGEPVQVVHDAVEIRLPVEDLRAIPADEREAEARREAAAEARKPFDLQRGPVLRARLLRLGGEEHVLLLTLHHIVSDAWTQGILDGELTRLYEAFRRGAPSPLRELPIQYADHAAWQRRWLAGEALEKQLGYWKAQLAGASFVLDLPADRPRPPVPSYRGDRRSFTLPAPLHRALVDLSRRRGVTLFMTLLAAFDVLLHRWSGQGDLVVGSPMTNRSRPETEGLIGFFLDTLVLRVELSGDLSFADLLQRVREVCLGAYAHQDVPFERLVSALAPERDLSRTPLFQVMLTLQTAKGTEASAELPGLKRRSLLTAVETAKFDLSLFLFESPRGLSGVFEYATDLFDAATVDRLAAQLAVLLQGIVLDPDRPLRELPLLPEPERHRVLVAWNDTAFAYPGDPLVHEVFAAQAARSPDAVAASFEGHDLTFGELAARAGRVARWLRRSGVRPETLVGVCMERSLDLVVALLGVLMAGGAYVPLDPEHPAERLAFMLDDARPAVILAQAHLAGALPAGGPRVVRLDADWPLFTAETAAEAEAGAASDGELSPENLAYVIYTSGSTGRPKGAMNAHRGIRNRLLWMQRAHGIGAGDVVLQKTPFGFDVSVWELLWPLMSGARLVLARPGGHRDPGYLAGTLAAEGVTTVHFVPSMLALFLDDLAPLGAGARALCGALRRVFCSGEVLPAALAARFFAALPGVELHNLYGPTEAAVEVTAGAVLPGARSVTLGRPIDNTRVYVLDAHAEPVPVGVRGELCIGGVQVGRGYLNRPDLTAERFVPDPFAAPGSPARLYRTGDMARWRASGEIEYLGRADFQVKLRGVRIELGEIEAALLRHPAVREAVVVVHARTPADSRLVAYVVPAGEAAPALGDLRAFLADQLPDAMVPAAFVALGALPLTPSGKVDRRALPAPEDAAGAGAGAASVPPRDEVEIRIAAIWREVLGLRAVGVTESFFDLGGHSLLAVRMMAEVERAFGEKIPLVALFEAQTVEALARVVRRSVEHGEEARAAWPSIVPIRARGSKRPLFLIARPNVNALGYLTLVHALDPEQPVYGLQMEYPEEADLGRPYTLEERRGWVQRYLDLLRAVQPQGPYLLAGMCEGALIAFEMTRRLEAEGDRVAFLGMLDTWPEENTSDRLRHAIYMRERTLRALLARSRPEQIAFLERRARSAWRAVVGAFRSGRARSRRPRMSPWDVRMYPGPSFVPPAVRCRIDVFRTPDQPYWRIQDGELGWGSRTTGGVDVHYILGDHDTFMRAEHVSVLARHLRECLCNAEEQIELAALEAALASGCAAGAQRAEIPPISPPYTARHALSARARSVASSSAPSAR